MNWRWAETAVETLTIGPVAPGTGSSGIRSPRCDAPAHPGPNVLCRHGTEPRVSRCGNPLGRSRSLASPSRCHGRGRAGVLASQQATRRASAASIPWRRMSPRPRPGVGSPPVDRNPGGFNARRTRAGSRRSAVRGSRHPSPTRATSNAHSRRRPAGRRPSRGHARAASRWSACPWTRAPRLRP